MIFVLVGLFSIFIFDKINENGVTELTNKFFSNVVNKNSNEIANLFCNDTVLVGSIIGNKTIKQNIEEHFASLPNITIIEKKFDIKKLSFNVYINNAVIKLSADNLSEPATIRMTFIIRGNCILQLHSSGLPNLANLYAISS